MDKSVLSQFNNTIESLIIYNSIKTDPIISMIINMNEYLISDNLIEARKIYYNILPLLINAAEENGFTGDIFQQYAAKLFLFDENKFSILCEKNCANIGSNRSIYNFALSDIEILLYILKYDFKVIGKSIGNDEDVTNYTPSTPKENAGVLQLLNYKTADSVMQYLIMYYQTMGIGYMADYAMFRIDYRNKSLVPIKNSDTIKFTHIIGYERQKNLLCENIEAFLQGSPANNVLLIGSRGTGKSSMVKSLVNEYFDKNLRLVELVKDDLKHIPEIMDILKNRGKKFIIFFDDLSFDEFETQYKYLKSILEGSAETCPDNVLFHATSNRRHIISERWSDKNGNQETDELHTTDTVNEKLSLSDRFGLTVTFPTPSPRQYLDIVYGIAKRQNIELTEEYLQNEAAKWEIAQSGLSGRTAKQFVNHLLCIINNNNNK